MTAYTVLKKKGDDWTEAARVQAASSRAAISKALDEDKNGAGTYVAIPSRSFVPVPIEFETKIKFG